MDGKYTRLQNEETPWKCPTNSLVLHWFGEVVVMPPMHLLLRGISWNELWHFYAAGMSMWFKPNMPGWLAN